MDVQGFLQLIYGQRQKNQVYRVLQVTLTCREYALQLSPQIVWGMLKHGSRYGDLPPLQRIVHLAACGVHRVEFVRGF